MLTLLSIGRYPTKVPYDDAWIILSNTRQLLPRIESSNIKTENVSISHLRMYLTITDDRDDDITIIRAFIIFMMGHLWFQTANNTISLGYLAVVADLDKAAEYDWGFAILAFLYHGLDTAVTTGGAITGFSQLLEYWFYEYCGVGHPIVKEDVKFSSYPRLKAWERGNRKKTNDLLTGTAGIPLDPPLNMSPHLCPADLQAMRQAGFVDCDQFVMGEERETYTSYYVNQTYEVGYLLKDSQRMGNIDLFGPTTLWAGITPVVVRLAAIHSLSQYFSLPDEEEGSDLGWYMEWTGRHEMFPIHRLRDPPPMSSSYDADELWHLTHGMRRLCLAESAWDTQMIQKLIDGLVTAYRYIDNIDDKLYSHPQMSSSSSYSSIDDPLHVLSSSSDNLMFDCAVEFAIWGERRDSPLCSTIGFGRKE
ncbi:hypothetical protein GIB67_042144, partial [Kingdonia uniflora]